MYALPRPYQGGPFTAPEYPRCPHCQSAGLKPDGVKNGRRRYKCRACGRSSYGTPPEQAPAEQPCPHCGAVRLVRDGHIDGRQRYRCRACARTSWGVPHAPRPDYPCPYCRANCRRKQRTYLGGWVYFCPACKRHNTDLWPFERSPGGPFPHKITLYIHVYGSLHLAAYCNATGMNRAQAIRAIFRANAHAPVRRWATARHLPGRDGFDRTRVRSAPVEPWENEPLPARLPDGRSQATRHRLETNNRIRSSFSVIVVEKVTLMMDRAAYAGLLRAMRTLSLPHQDAARHLIETAPIKRNTPSPDDGQGGQAIW